MTFRLVVTADRDGEIDEEQIRKVSVFDVRRGGDKLTR